MLQLRTAQQRVQGDTPRDTPGTLTGHARDNPDTLPGRFFANTDKKTAYVWKLENVRNKIHTGKNTKEKRSACIREARFDCDTPK